MDEVAGNGIRGRGCKPHLAIPSEELCQLLLLLHRSGRRASRRQDVGGGGVVVREGGGGEGRPGGAAAGPRTISTGTMLTWRVLPSRSCSAVICCGTCGQRRPFGQQSCQVQGQNRRARAGTKGIRQTNDQGRRAVRAWPSDSLYGVCSIPAPLCGLCQGAREQSVSHSSIMAHGVLPDVLSMPANRAGADHGHPHTPGRQAGRPLTSLWDRLRPSGSRPALRRGPP